MSFDLSRPIDGEEIWFPKGMFINNLTNSRFGFDAGDDERAFIVDSSDTKAPNRFLGTGRLLPTTRNEYLRSLGILKTDPLSTNLASEINSLVVTYTKIKADCFTSEIINGVELSTLQAGAQEALTGLEDFHEIDQRGQRYCEYAKKIDATQAEVDEYQARIDGNNKVITDAHKYIWTVVTFIGVGLVQAAKNEVKAMAEAMEKIQAIMDEHKAEQKTASRLKLNINFVNNQVRSLTGEFRPVMRTLELLQEAWKPMATDLETIKHLIDNDTENLLPMILARPRCRKL